MSAERDRGCMILSVFAAFMQASRRLSIVGVRDGNDAPTLGAAVGFFPLVGLLIGIVAAFTLLASGAFFPEPVPVALTLAVVVAATGAIHDTGLMRVADRLSIGGGTAGRAGTIALVLVLGLKAAALMGMDSFSAARALIGVHAASRFAMVLAMWAVPAQGSSSGDSDNRIISSNSLALALLLGLLPAAIVLSPITAILAGFAGFAAAAVVAGICYRHGPGATQGTFDAVQQAFETAFLLVAAAVISGPG